MLLHKFISGLVQYKVIEITNSQSSTYIKSVMLLQISGLLIPFAIVKKTSKSSKKQDNAKSALEAALELAHQLVNC